MREIIFRGQRKDNKEWVYGYLLFDYEQNEAFIAEHFEDKSAYIKEVLPETVGQYTGLKDKNGKKIFEGDIVSVNGNDVLLFIEFTDLENEPEYMSLSFNCRIAGHHLYLHRLENKSTKYEVVGNIHSNPELLE